MERQKKPYSLHKRPTTRKNRWIFYVRFRDESGAYKTAVSTGCTNRDDAVRWCEERLRNGRRSSGTTLEVYAKGFWKEDGTYAQSRLAHGYHLSACTLYVADLITAKHILPKWGKCPLGTLTSGKIDAWIVQLHREGVLSSASINHLLQSLRTILQQAVSDGLIKENPAAYVRRVKLVQEERGILEMDEARRLLTEPLLWQDRRHFVLNLLAATTGARMGEIRGLQIADIFPDRIEIKHSWSDHGGLKEPKWGSVRSIPIAPLIYSNLEGLMAAMQPTSFLFYGEHGKDRPLGTQAIAHALYDAMKSIGISEVDRRQRHLSFHGWRHWLNTALRSRGLPDSKLRLITGHRSDEMSDRYTHFNARDFGEVFEFQKKVLGDKAAEVIA